MDWEPVPVGTLPPAALTARGADHDLDFAAGDSIEVALGSSLWVRNVVGGRRRISYSSFAGRLSSHFYSNDAAVLTHLVRGAVPGPAKLRALWLHIIGVGGVVATSALSIDEFDEAAEASHDALDYNALPAAVLLTAADLFAVEPAAGALGGLPTLWLRSLQYSHLAEDVPGHPGLVRFRWLGDWLLWEQPV